MPLGSQSAKPRVLYVINSLEIGGAEIGLSNLISGGLFVDSDLSIVTIWPANDDFLNSHPSIRDRYTGSLCSSSTRNYISILRSVVPLIKTVRDFGPNIVISSLAQSALLVRIVKILLGGFYLVSFEHSERLRTFLAELLMYFTKSAVDAVWADSITTLDSVVGRYKMGTSVERQLVPLYNLSSYLDTPLPEFDSSHPNLLYVGRLSPEKNLVAGMAALKLVRPDITPFLNIIGPKNDLSENIIERKLEGSEFVVFHGPSYDWHREWAGCGVLGVVISTREGASLTSLQLMSMGFPLITTAPGDVSNLAVDGVNSWIAKTTSSEDIAEAIRRAWFDRIRWPEMSKAARDAARRYHLSSVVQISSAAASLRRFVR